MTLPNVFTRPAYTAIGILLASVIRISSACSQNASQSNEIRVYITKSGKKYHSNECSYLGKSKTPINLVDAIAEGYTPCDKCDAVQLTKKLNSKE